MGTTPRGKIGNRTHVQPPRQGGQGMEGRNRLHAVLLRSRGGARGRRRQRLPEADRGRAGAQTRRRRAREAGESEGGVQRPQDPARARPAGAIEEGKGHLTYLHRIAIDCVRQNTLDREPFTAHEIHE